VSLRVFGARRGPRRSRRDRPTGSEPVEELFWQRCPDDLARERDDVAWFTDVGAGVAPELGAEPPGPDAEPPRLEWRAPAAPEFIRWRPPVSTLS
jgi:hypothetical protein